jgi:hypothetical protein
MSASTGCGHASRMSLRERCADFVAFGKGNIALASRTTQCRLDDGLSASFADMVISEMSTFPVGRCDDAVEK